MQGACRWQLKGAAESNSFEPPTKLNGKLKNRTQLRVDLCHRRERKFKLGRFHAAAIVSHRVSFASGVVAGFARSLELVELHLEVESDFSFGEMFPPFSISERFQLLSGFNTAFCRHNEPNGPVASNVLHC